jgi:hypothetical protein
MIDLVNSSGFTLTNSVYGANIEDCMTVAMSLRSGSAHINGLSVSVLSNSCIFILGRDISSGRGTWRTRRLRKIWKAVKVSMGLPIGVLSQINRQKGFVPLVHLH